MHCPKCDSPEYEIPAPCPNCGFKAAPAQLEELAHLNWLLNQIDTWDALGINQTGRQRLQQAYTTRKQELEVAIGLRLPPFTPQEAREAWPDLIHREILLEKVGNWLAQGLVHPAATQLMVDQARRQMDELQEQLAGHKRPPYPHTPAEHLDALNFLLEAVNYLQQNRSFTSAAAQEQIQAPLLAQKESLEIELGLRPPLPLPAQPPARPDSQVPAPPPPAPEPEQPEPPAVPPAPPPPLLERLGRTLLSERTLHAMLFLGIFLLFSAALSFVIWGWKDFSAPLRVAIPAGFTILFFALGWVVRTKTPLYRSGIALSAIAALLIPIDFYTIYANFNIPANVWPAFWLITSLFCLAAYTLGTLAIQSRIFGYLVGAAAGSTVLAGIELGHQMAALSLDWRTAGLSGLAAILLGLAWMLDRRSPTKRRRAFAVPFRYLALLTAAVLMPLTFGWRYLNHPTYDTFHTALTINWWLGGLMFGWGAVYYRSRSLGLLAAVSLPVAVYLTQAAIFEQRGINPAWHAFGWAWLVLLYFIAGYKLLQHPEDPILRGHGRTATRWGVALLIAAALWSLTDLSGTGAGAASHAVLSAAVVVAALLWQRPAYLYAASLLSFTAATFAFTELELTLPQLSVGWASLALLHLLVALAVGARFAAAGSNYAAVLVTGGYAIAGLALLPPLLPYNGHLLAYSLGNWLGISAWGAWLAHHGRPGFAVRQVTLRLPVKPKTFNGAAIFHWFTAVPLPVWVWVLFTNRRPVDFSLPLALAALAWAMVILGYRLNRSHNRYRYPWHLVGGIVSILAPVLAFAVAPQGFTPALVLLAVGLLYLADALTGRQSGELFIAGLVIAWGYLRFLDRLSFSFDALSFALALLIAVYILAGLWAERRAAGYASTALTHAFLRPLYLAAHLLALYLLWRIYVQPFNRLFFNIPWTNAMRLWGAAAQLLAAVVYGLYAWGTYREHWGHAAAWLAAAAGGFIAIAYSTGRGSSAAKAALVVAAFILAERGLHWLRQHRKIPPRRLALVRLAWRLYRRPLLVTGWVGSAVVIGLALVRNLWWLGGGRIQQIWAVAGLLLVTGLYALSARLFRKARFMWLAAVLIIAPWTILTNLGWFTSYRPTTPGFALGWMALAWLLFAAGLLLARYAPAAYALPLQAVAHGLVPFSLLWGVANVDTGRFTVGLATGLYALAAWVDRQRGHTSRFRATRFLYPAVGLIPVWSVYLLAWLLPAARHEHYGLMLLLFGPLGLAAGHWFYRTAPSPQMARAYALPAYLTGYVSAIAGTMLTAHISPLLALVLLVDTLLLAVSAWHFKNPLWVYPAAGLVPIALLISLHEAGIPANRHGWWLMGLAAVYLALARTLRQAKLPAYATAPLAIGFALVALGLPPSSQDQIGALWGYAAAALLYAISAFWLGQPLLLTPAAALVLVPYAVGLQRSTLLPDYYGLALLPGAVAALTLGHVLDARFGRFDNFPWGAPVRWPEALAARLLGWWGLPLYGLGLGLATAGPFFTNFRSGLTALSFLLLMPVYAWAIYRFRLRIWLLGMALAGQLAAVYYLDALGWWRYPAWAWLRFLPVTAITAGAGLLIEHGRREGSPLAGRLWAGWSRPLYLLLGLDLLLAQILSLEGSWAAAAVTLANALLLAALASVWTSGWLLYAAQGLGVLALVQQGVAVHRPVERVPVALSQLALAYGVVGYGLAWLRVRLNHNRELRPWAAVWELPLQRFSIGMSLVIFVLAALLGADIVGWTVRAMFGLPLRQIVDLTTVQMAVGVLSLLGLLYLAAAVTHRWLRLGYGAIGMLLTAWMLYAFYIQQWDRLARVQWYAIPAGLYILGIAYLEWQKGHKTLARWLDYAALLLMMGSLFWQTLLFGWGYATLLGAEGFLAFWWGSARRLRRFFYAGMVGVILATLGQLINSLRSINQWIVFGIIGLLLVGLAILVERKLEDIKAWQERILETWE